MQRPFPSIAWGLIFTLQRIKDKTYHLKPGPSTKIVFVQISNSICQNCQIYFPNCSTVFVWIDSNGSKTSPIISNLDHQPKLYFSKLQRSTTCFLSKACCMLFVAQWNWTVHQVWCMHHVSCTIYIKIHAQVWSTLWLAKERLQRETITWKQFEHWWRGYIRIFKIGNFS